MATPTITTYTLSLHDALPISIMVMAMIRAASSHPAAIQMPPKTSQSTLRSSEANRALRYRAGLIGLHHDLHWVRQQPHPKRAGDRLRGRGINPCRAADDRRRDRHAGTGGHGRGRRSEDRSTVRRNTRVRTPDRSSPDGREDRRADATTDAIHTH